MFHVDLPWTWFIAQGAYSSDNNCQSQKRQRISLNVSHDPRVSWPPWRDVTPLSGTETLPSCERQVVMRASVLYQTHHLSCVINRDMFFLASTIPPLSTTFMPSVQGYHRERLTSQGKNRGPVTQSALDEEGLKDEDKERAWEWNTETKWQPQVYVTTSTIPTWGRERISLTKGSCVRILLYFPVLDQRCWK